MPSLERPCEETFFVLFHLSSFQPSLEIWTNLLNKVRRGILWFNLPRSNQYDGVEEFWVDVRTTGLQSYSEKHTEQEKQTKICRSFDAIS